MEVDNITTLDKLQRLRDRLGQTERFVLVPATLLEDEALSSTSKILYCILLSYSIPDMKKEQRFIKITQKHLANKLHKTILTIHHCLNELKTFGWVELDTTERPARIYIFQKSKICSKAKENYSKANEREIKK